jgi:hypothetical protein
MRHAALGDQLEHATADLAASRQARRRRGLVASEVTGWKGTVEPTVDGTKHVNGGCRALTSDGLEWQCYIGEAAVDEQIVSADFLGEYAPSPGVG